MEVMPYVAVYLLGLYVGMTIRSRFAMSRLARAETLHQEVSSSLKEMEEIKAQVSEMHETMSKKHRAMREFASLWNYGARSEAVDVLESAGVATNKG